jgi:hypothetical protein
VFTFLSGLYFRGKLGYCARVRAAARERARVVVITTSEGLVSPESPVTLDRLRRWAAVPIDAGEARYRVRSCATPSSSTPRRGPGARWCLLGSIAERKYADVLLKVFGERLLFPVRRSWGRGDMSRGGLMLRCTDSRKELDYVPVATSVRHGERPPRLQPRRRPRPAAG